MYRIRKEENIFFSPNLEGIKDMFTLTSKM